VSASGVQLIHGYTGCTNKMKLKCRGKEWKKSRPARIYLLSCNPSIWSSFVKEDDTDRWSWFAAVIFRHYSWPPWPPVVFCPHQVSCLPIWHAHFTGTK